MEEVSARREHSGAFRRHPMLAGSDDLDQLREALHEAPRLRALLSQLVDG